MTASSDRDWKLKLRYGKTKTEFEHFTAIAEGVVGSLSGGFSCRMGKAFFGMKMWASSIAEANDMVRVIGKQVGFTVTGRILLYKTDAEQPPRKDPHGYDLNFTPFD